MIDGDFDLHALAVALDEQREAAGLSWAGVVRETRGSDQGRGRELSASTLRGIGSRAIAEGDGVLQMLRWLKRSPESFIAGNQKTKSAPLPEVSDNKVLRFDTRKLFGALDSERIERKITWEQLAIETRWSVSGLKRLSQGGRIAFPAVIRLTVWLNQPAANFVRAADRGRLPSWRTR